MSQLEERQKYYEYDPREGDGWWKKNPPPRETWFEDALVDLAGLHDGKYPRLRVVWGGTVMHDITFRPQLKYKAVREYTKGFYYIKKDGTEGYVKSMNLATDAMIPWQFHPCKKTVELGRLRWAIEKYVSAEELGKQGRLQNPYAPDGERILRDFPSEGIYECFFWIQRANFKYRDLDREVLTAVQAMWKYNTTVSEAQQALDQIERESQRTLLGDAEARAIWSNLGR